MTLRPYQLDCLQAIQSGWQEFQRQLVVSPTGSGKTIMFCQLAKVEHWRTLVLVDQGELAWQTVDKMKRAAGLDCEVEMAAHSASLTAKVVCATVQSMARRLADWPANHFSLVIADEADRSISPQWQKVLNHFDGTDRVCGFTATPNRADKRSLGEYYQNVAFEISLLELIKQEYLAPISIKQLPLTIDLKGVRTKAGDYDAHDLDDAITPHLAEVAKAIKEHASFRRVLVFVPLIATSKKFVDVAKAHGLAAEHIDGTSEDRADKLRRFADWEFDVLVNSCLLLRGVDIPGIDCVVMLRPTKSITLYQQAIGRGTRLASGKKDLLILDFLYAATKNLVCRPAHLIAKTDEEAQSMVEIAEAKAGLPSEVAGELPLDLETLATDAQAAREEKLRLKFEELRNRKAKYISSEEFALKYHNVEAAEFEPAMKWEAEPPSAKQERYLKQAGIDLATVRGKGHATKLLSIYFANKPLKLASPAQRWKMKQMGHPDADRATEQEARNFFKGLKTP